MATKKVISGVTGKNQADQVRQLIAECKTMDELEALNPQVVEVFGENIPDDVQALADEVSKKIQANDVNDIFVKRGEVTVKDPDDWKPASLKEIQDADKIGKLAGYNPRTGYALILK
jgi:hypothetical protein